MDLTGTWSRLWVYPRGAALLLVVEGVYAALDICQELLASKLISQSITWHLLSPKGYRFLCDHLRWKFSFTPAQPIKVPCIPLKRDFHFTVPPSVQLKKWHRHSDPKACASITIGLFSKHPAWDYLSLWETCLRPSDRLPPQLVCKTPPLSSPGDLSSGLKQLR